MLDNKYDIWLLQLNSILISKYDYILRYLVQTTLDSDLKTTKMQ